ncbi:TPA: baseplate assembly protein [Escherichia coli]|nr:baseplate assembly protein [Escherichia coli]HAO2781077.1 baseplate assembly protein [Escherichia coli]
MPIIDLNQLPAPDVVEELDFETILTERKATLISLYPEDQQEAVARTLTLESEPLVKLLEENAYRELIWRQRVNEAARAVMLACAAGNDLDVIGANYNTTRLTITPADDSTIPPTPAVMESDTDYRLRIQQAFEGLSVAGSVGAYQYHGRSADGRVADISVTSPSPACVTISVLSRENNGVASEDLLAVVRNALNGEDVRPVADRVTVQSAAIVEYQINATLYLYPGPESEPIRAAAVKKLEAYITAQHRLGRDIRLSAIYAALHVEGVQRVELAAPLADIVLNSTQASFCTGGGTTNAQFTYINHGDAYAPGWRRDYNTKNQQPAFALGQTGSRVANDKAVGWNWNSGVYDADISGASTLILHFNMNAGSCPAVQFRVNYKNGGIFYRSARDGYGFEDNWSEFYTTTRKPSAGDVGAYTKAESDSRYVRDIRLGTRVVQTMQKGVMYEKSGHVITGLGIVGEVDGDDPAVFRPIQKYINGTWYNVAQV